MWVSRPMSILTWPARLTDRNTEGEAEATEPLSSPGRPRQSRPGVAWHPWLPAVPWSGVVSRQHGGRGRRRCLEGCILRNPPIRLLHQGHQGLECAPSRLRKSTLLSWTFKALCYVTPASPSKALACPVIVTLTLVLSDHCVSPVLGA